MITGGQVIPHHRDLVTAGASVCGRPPAALLELRGFDNAPGLAVEVLWDHARLGLLRFDRLTPRHVPGRALLTKRPRAEQGADDDGAAGEDATHARSRIAGPAPTAGWTRSRAGRRRCPRRRLMVLMSRHLPGVSECVPWPACELRDGSRLAASQVRGRRRIQVIRHRVKAGRDGIAAIPDFIGRAMAGRCYRGSSGRGGRGCHAATTHDGRPKTTARVRPGPR
jgi:hypothetical protein